MLRDRVKKYYLDEGYNCAESMLLAANEEYAMGLGESELQLMKGFGGGMAVGHACGALTGSVAALGKLCCIDKDKDTSHEIIAEFVEAFEKVAGHTRCDVLTPMYKKEDVRCYELLLKAADALEESVRKWSK